MLSPTAPQFPTLSPTAPYTLQHPTISLKASCAPPGSAPALFMLPHSPLTPPGYSFQPLSAPLSHSPQIPAPLQPHSPVHPQHPTSLRLSPQTPDPADPTLIPQTPTSPRLPRSAPHPHLDHVQLGHLVLLQAHGQQDVVLLDQHGGGGGQRGQLLRGLPLHRNGPASGQFGPVRHPSRTARGALSSARYRSVRV